ncbi:hypothetical protein I4U23_027061 [Adineta vaga]|nr:hypothetical protein I4U23_027061 [Adineta vaga]
MIQFPLPTEKILPDQIKLRKIPDYHEKDDVCNRIIGSLIGLAIGDALGASVEFRPQQYLVANPVKSMEGGGTWGLEAGQWTDDTSMALCLASSLIVENGFNPYNQMVRYKWWHKYGYLSSTGHCFDIGQATRQALKEFSLRQQILKISYRCRNEYETDTLTLDSVERTKDFNLNCGEPDSAGNGALMRLAPVPLFYFQSPSIAIEYAGRSALLTHPHKKAVDACRYYAALIIATLQGSTKEDLFDKDFYVKHKEWFGEEILHEDIHTIIQGSFKKPGGYDDGIRGKGYIINALEAALWAFWSDGDSFEKGACAAVNLGDDTDTTAAIYGQLAGAFYGYNKIPKEWMEKLYARDLIVTMGEWLHFQGTQRQLDYYTKIKFPIDEKIISKIDHQYSTTTQNSTDESKSKPMYTQSTSLDSPRITSNNDIDDIHFHSTNFDEEDPYTTNAYHYGFYRNNSKLN